jgi:6-pyruvoyltetrahydropterin/6-carboxytetrahydropterin synthase
MMNLQEIYKQLTITKIFTFDTAHALENYPGKCRHIHGHTYTLHVTVSGEMNGMKQDPYEGLIIDFTQLKEWVKREVISRYDHFLLLAEGSPLANLNYPEWERIRLTPYQPSCENMLADICQRLLKNPLKGITLEELQLFETPTSYASWRKKG